MHKSKRALFLDRDGVINVNHGYVYEKENFEWISGIFRLVKRANDNELAVIIITNQSGIGRGYYSESQFHLLSEWMLLEFRKQDCQIDAVYFCPHHPEKAKPPYNVICDCRKPKPGMILTAAAEHEINLGDSIFVGDKASDMIAAASAGIGRRILFGGDKTQLSEFHTEVSGSLASII